VNDQLGAGSDEELLVEDAPPAKDSIWENHFDDGEKLTTVTVIEDFDQVGLETVNPPTHIPDAVEPSPAPKSKKIPPEHKKKKSFRYGTKAERQSDRRKAKLKKQKHGRK
jgi:hypothetical protein